MPSSVHQAAATNLSDSKSNNTQHVALASCITFNKSCRFLSVLRELPFNNHDYELAAVAVVFYLDQFIWARDIYLFIVGPLYLPVRTCGFQVSRVGCSTIQDWEIRCHIYMLAQVEYGAHSRATNSNSLFDHMVEYILQGMSCACGCGNLSRCVQSLCFT